MNKHNTAFPVSYGPDGTSGYSAGMTLRDYFAGQALVSIWGAYINNYFAIGMNGIAVDAYKMADAMLAERDK